ncbi:MAG: HI0074 family nucleotidyltransferase substrate-binding subunit [Pseudomonadota bacterium]|nr:HI0074 family nucleotidyltransferase substrate-binding subunit [Pseudomonadota bacterium]
MKAETKDSMLFFSKALQRFAEALAEDQSNPLAIDGSIQRFEFCFELGWKLIKKMLMDVEGIEALSPKKALQSAYQLGWIEDEQAWLKMLNDRNLTSHTYREEYAQEIYSKLPIHLKQMQLLQIQVNQINES